MEVVVVVGRWVVFWVDWGGGGPGLFEALGVCENVQRRRTVERDRTERKIQYLSVWCKRAPTLMGGGVAPSSLKSGEEENSWERHPTPTTTTTTSSNPRSEPTTACTHTHSTWPLWKYPKFNQSLQISWAGRPPPEYLIGVSNQSGL